MAKQYGRIGEVYRKTQNMSEAISAFQKAFEIDEQEKNLQGMGIWLGMLGDIYLKDDIHEALKDSLFFAGHLFDAHDGIEVVTDLSDEMLFVQGDLELLKQVFLNLI